MSEQFVFWDGSGKISSALLYEFLGKMGFGKFYPLGNDIKNSDPIIVRVQGNVVSEVKFGYILEIVRQHILICKCESGEIESILESLHRNIALLGSKNLMLLSKLDLEFITDSRYSAFFFFRNGIVEITAESISIKDYDDYDQYIWERDIKDSDYIRQDFNDLIDFEYVMFLLDLCRVESDEHSNLRFDALRSAIGYLLHRYKDGLSNKAIILMDVFVNGNPNGGSGKSLLINSIGKIRKVAPIDGKKYDQREWFALSSAGLNTEIILFDDAKKDFNFEGLFALMTEGLMLKRKYRDDIFIPHKDAPKVAITTNYAIIGNSSSFKRRMYEFEVSSTYSAYFSPRDKFGRNFFDDWNEYDWNIFYNVMFNCLQYYLRHGLIESEPINIGLTKLTNQTNEDFVEWAEEYLQTNGQLDKKDLYESFTGLYSEHRLVKQRVFTDWLRIWGDYKNYNVQEGHSGNVRHITFAD